MTDNKNNLLDQLTNRGLTSDDIARTLLVLAASKAREANKKGLKAQLYFLSNLIGLSDEEIIAIVDDIIGDYSESKKITMSHPILDKE